MTHPPDIASELWGLTSILRDAGEPLVLLDVVRCLLFLKYAASGSFCLSKDEKPLTIPKEARWSYLQRREHDLAGTLARACQRLQEVNPVLEGTMAVVDFTRIERWNDGRRDRILKDLIESISKLPDVEEATAVGKLYDSLVIAFAEDSAKNGIGEMFLSVPLARLMVALLELESGMRVCDPVCKTGRTLIACVTHALEKRLDITVHGQEPNEQLMAICKMNLFLHGARNARIQPGDTLRAPMLTAKGELIRYDRVLMAPPINRTNWGAVDAAEDRHCRFPIVPPRHSADFAYIMHCLSALEDGGRAVVLTGRGVLFRQGAEEPLRKMLVDGDQLEAVIGLPGGLLYGTHIPAALLVLRKGKSPRSGKVLFVEAQRSNGRRSRHIALGSDEIDALATCVHHFQNMVGMSRIVDLEEIAHNQWALNPAVYIPREVYFADIDLVERTEAIRLLEAERDEAAFLVDQLVREVTEELDR